MKKKQINIILLVVLTTLVLYFALKDDYVAISSLLWSSDIRWLFVGFLLTMGYCLFKAIILNNIISQFKSYSMNKTLKLQIMTFFFNAVTPFATGGQPFQIYTLKKSGLAVSEGTNVIMQESILHQCSMLLLSIIALILNFIFNFCEMTSFLSVLFILGFLANTFVLILLFVLAYAKKVDHFMVQGTIRLLVKLKIIKDREVTMKRWEESIEKFHEGSKMLLQDKIRFLKLIGINMMGLTAIYIVPLTILFSLGNYTAFSGLTALVLTIFVSLISSFVPLPGGTGGQEYLFVLLFGIYITNPLLNSVMILWRFITYYVPMIIGGILFNLRKREG